MNNRNGLLIAVIGTCLCGALLGRGISLNEPIIIVLSIAAAFGYFVMLLPDKKPDPLRKLRQGKGGPPIGPTANAITYARNLGVHEIDMITLLQDDGGEPLATFYAPRHQLEELANTILASDEPRTLQ